MTQSGHRNVVQRAPNLKINLPRHLSGTYRKRNRRIDEHTRLTASIATKQYLAMIGIWSVQIGSLAARLTDRAVLKFVTAGMLLKHRPAVTIFRNEIGRAPRLVPPHRKSDKFFWRKAFDHNPLFEIFCNKLACKEWASAKCPNLPIPSTIWQGDSAKDLPDELLVPSVIVKANAGSGYNIVPEGSDRDREGIERKFAVWLSIPYGRRLAEWGYQSVARTMFVEELITGPNGEAPVMIYVYSISGEPVCFYCITGRVGDQRCDAFFLLNGERLQIQVKGFDPIPEGWRAPSGFDKAVQFARILAQGIDNIRCDFMCVGDRVWFSEMTPYSGSGLSLYADPSHGDGPYEHWDIRQSWFLTTPQKGWKRIYAASLLRQLPTHYPTPRLN